MNKLLDQADMSSLVGTHYIQRFEIQKIFEADNRPSCRVNISLKDKCEGAEAGILVQFNRVVDLVVGDMNGLEACLINIENIASWGLEDTRFRVSDEETNQFSFKCADYRIEKAPQQATDSLP
ncbi:hypothetical protein [Labrenzia sp. VG12]|uniref:hypothetical protein n=1 Tax=Labrenzia sp. VG12 TaxID=2021862 RepID=UPI0012FD8AE6|nr:hypothetical protein [Labrenzia sp. VG12]